MDVTDNFWKTALRWWQNKRYIVVEFSGQRPPLALAYTGTVVALDREAITFRDVKSNKDQAPINFAGAEIRLHSFDSVNSANAFVASRQDEFQSVECVLTELRTGINP